MKPVNEDNTKPGKLFSQPWWLDAVAPGRWEAIEVEKGGKLVARLPLVFNEARTQCLMPPLTQALGPWIDVGEGKLAKRLSKHKELSGALIEQIPKSCSFAQRFSYANENWLPWYWKGFVQTTRYTYVLSDLSDCLLYTSPSPRD